MGVSENFVGLIQRTSDDFIRDNIYMIDKTMLARALSNIAPPHQEKVFRNMPPDSAAEVRRIIGSLGSVSAASIEAAQQEIMSLAAQAI